MNHCEKLHIFFLNEIADNYTLPKDIVFYMFVKFCASLLTAAREKEIIEQAWYYWWEGLTKRSIRLLEESPIHLDNRIPDGRIERYVNLLGWILKREEAPTTTQFVLNKGVEIESVEALCLLYTYGYSNTSDISFEHLIERARKKLSALDRWNEDDVNHIKTLTTYYIDRQIGEPILEWLRIKNTKGLDPFINMNFCTLRQLGFFLRLKVVSQEYKPILLDHVW